MVLAFQTARGNSFILFQMILLPNINFLINKKNKTPKRFKIIEAIDWYCYLFSGILRDALSFTQIEHYNQI